MTTQTQLLEQDPQETRARARVGAVLQDKWKLDSLLGMGGMAAVYAATHRNGKRVAVKMLHAELSHDEDVRRRFLQEGYAANKIQHEGAVSVLDDDVAADGAAFIVMELLEGETVEQRWESSGRKLPVLETLALTDQLLDVLAAAHDKDVVHRDIKPENLFVTRAGVLKVLDFGIAKMFERQPARSTATRAGVIMGTPAFMAPEQARARWEEVDGRTDLWAVGATMFTLLTGLNVHEGQSSHEQLILSATTPATSLAAVNSEVPPAIVALVDRALAFDRATRWPDARTMQQAVREILEALGGVEPAIASGRAPAGTFLSGRSRLTSAMHTSGPTLLDTTGKTSAVTAWTKERDARSADVTRLRASIAELQQRQVAARKATVDAEATVEAARSERASLEQWFQRQVGTRTAAVDEARGAVREKMVALARRALEDRAAFGAERDEARAHIVRLERASASAARDVTVHAAARTAYDRPALRNGVVLLGVAALLVLALIVGPIVWRATRVIAPPLPTTTFPAR